MKQEPTEATRQRPGNAAGIPRLKVGEDVKEQNKSLRPVTKIQSSINWGAFATIVVTVIAVFFPDAYSRLPPGFEVSFGVFLGSFVASLAGWMKRDRPA